MERKLSELTAGSVFKYDDTTYLVLERRPDLGYVMVENLSNEECYDFDIELFVEVIH